MFYTIAYFALHVVKTSFYWSFHINIFAWCRNNESFAFSPVLLSLAPSWSSRLHWITPCFPVRDVARCLLWWDLYRKALIHLPRLHWKRQCNHPMNKWWCLCQTNWAVWELMNDWPGCIIMRRYFRTEEQMIVRFTCVFVSVLSGSLLTDVKCTIVKNPDKDVFYCFLNKYF